MASGAAAVSSCRIDSKDLCLFLGEQAVDGLLSLRGIFFLKVTGIYDAVARSGHYIHHRLVSGCCVVSLLVESWSNSLTVIIYLERIPAIYCFST